MGNHETVPDLENGAVIGIPRKEPVASANEDGKALILWDALHPNTVMESNYLHALMADMYQDNVDVEHLTYPVINIMAHVRARIQAADHVEVKWWRQVFVAF